MLLQDELCDSEARRLSQWFASRPNARQEARLAVSVGNIPKGNEMANTEIPVKKYTIDFENYRLDVVVSVKNIYANSAEEAIKQARTILLNPDEWVSIALDSEGAY